MASQRRLGSWIVNGSLFLLVLVWSIPIIGLLVSSFRDRFDSQTTGWWTILPHQEWQKVGDELDPKALGLDPTGVMEVAGVTGTFEEMREGIESPDGATRVTWIGNR